MSGPDNPTVLYAIRVWLELVRRRAAGFWFRLLCASRGSYVDRGCSIVGIRNVSIGGGVVVHRRCEFTTLPGSRLTIGAGSRIGADAVIAVAQEVQLGRNVLIAARCYISDYGHAFEDTGRPVMHQGATAPAPVHIGDGSWLGINVCILPGVTLGRNCVVGANSVVTRSLPDGSIAAGVPARVIRVAT